jgi:hypothetical protein
VAVNNVEHELCTECTFRGFILKCAVPNISVLTYFVAYHIDLWSYSLKEKTRVTLFAVAVGFSMSLLLVKPYALCRFNSSSSVI